ncbi:hypothetical protein GCM10010246_77360 [Streptomyces cuspidosporus]|uniref:Lipoprotein n=1 Tax=Streptomyces cuspidosporus TaxID=66882 RepID=A0ABN3H7N1_9ACTN
MGKTVDHIGDGVGMSGVTGRRQMQTVMRAVGRRTALRYLSVGIGASVLAACSNGSGAGGSTGLVGQAVSAFVKGKWRVELSSDRYGNQGGVALVEITARSWTVEPQAEHSWEQDDVWSWRGQWAIQGSELTLKGPWRAGESGPMRRWVALDVPGRIVEAKSIRLPWKIFSGGSPDTDELRVKYAESTLHIVHIDGDGTRTALTCTRA